LKNLIPWEEFHPGGPAVVHELARVLRIGVPDLRVGEPGAAA
jgi:hypothetical protein